uniref:Protein DEK n=1 Tax=Tetraselmis sp. GSL018 TaxID=582737 RepID=A0A061RQ95_9CHLO|mmetsp:Transcript_8686/g.20939  ORF Transcript_8686/g.20939 Transcript_8686/m.20939 type:complete len:514 (+) Transcript_8686:232-1773(+)
MEVDTVASAVAGAPQIPVADAADPKATSSIPEPEEGSNDVLPKADSGPEDAKQGQATDVKEPTSNGEADKDAAAGEEKSPERPKENGGDVAATTQDKADDMQVDEEPPKAEGSPHQTPAQTKGSARRSPAPLSTGVRSSVRERKSVEHFQITDSRPAPDPVVIKEGSGKKLSDIPNIVFHFSKINSKDELMALLHRLLFRAPGKVTTRKKEILAFSGFVYDDKEADRQWGLEKLLKWKLDDVHKLMDALDMQRGAGTKEDKVKRVIDFLEEPKVLSNKDLQALEDKKKAAAKRKREREAQKKEKQSKKGKTAASKAKKASTPKKTPAKKAKKPEEEEEEDDDEDDMEEEQEEEPEEEEEEEEEEAPKKKKAKAAAPAKKPAASKTPAKAPSKKGKEASEEKKAEPASKEGGAKEEEGKEEEAVEPSKPADKPADQAPQKGSADGGAEAWESHCSNDAEKELAREAIEIMKTVNLKEFSLKNLMGKLKDKTGKDVTEHKKLLKAVAVDYCMENS